MCVKNFHISLKLVMYINMENGTKEKWGVAKSLRASPILFRFYLFHLVRFCYRLVFACSSEIRTLVYDKYAPNCHYNIFYLSLTIFFLNVIIAKNILTLINKLIGIKPKIATLLKE